MQKFTTGKNYSNQNFAINIFVMYKNQKKIKRIDNEKFLLVFFFQSQINVKGNKSFKEP